MLTEGYRAGAQRTQLSGRGMLSPGAWEADTAHPSEYQGPMSQQSAPTQHPQYSVQTTRLASENTAESSGKSEGVKRSAAFKKRCFSPISKNNWKHHF